MHRKLILLMPTLFLNPCRKIMKNNYSDVTTLNHMRVGEDFYTHVINRVTDNTHLLNNDGLITFTVDGFYCSLVNSNGNLMGHFMTDRDGGWVFTDIDNQVLQNTNRDKSDLIKFELDVFKHLLTTKQH